MKTHLNEAEKALRKHNARLFLTERSEPRYTGVYFILWGGFIKIGCAHDVVTRRRAIETSFPCGDVTGLGWIPCSSSLYPWKESQVHGALRAYCVRGEWFQDCEAVRALIARHAMPWPR